MIDRTPSRRSVAFAGGVAAMGSLPLALAGFPVVVGLAGAAAVTAGVARGSRRVVTVGALVSLVGIFLAGAFGVPPTASLFALAGTVLAWDIGQHGIGVGQQLGRAADTRRLELVHAGTSTLVVAGTAGIGYLVFTVGVSGQSRGALALLLVAGAALTLALSPR